MSRAAGRVTRVLDGIHDPEGVALGFGSLWVVQHRHRSIARVDLASWTVSTVIPLPGTGSNSTCGNCVDDVVVGPSAIWVPLALGRAVVRIDPKTNLGRLHPASGALKGSRRDPVRVQSHRREPLRRRVGLGTADNPNGVTLMRPHT